MGPRLDLSAIIQLRNEKGFLRMKTKPLEMFMRQFLLEPASEWTLQTAQDKYGMKLPAGTSNYEVLKSIFPELTRDDGKTETVL